MADSENKNLETTNSTIQANQVENQTIPTQSNNEPNPMNEGQGNQDFSKLFSENITIDSSDPTNIQSQNTQHAELNNAVADTTNMNNNTPENKNLETSSQTTLGDNKEQTTNAANAAQTTQPTQENSLEKAQKEKLIQLIKVHELKAQKKGLTKGILYGVVLTIGIVALSIIFAKDQVVNLLNNQPENNLPLNANIVDLNNQNVEDNNENETDLLTGDILLTGDDQDLTGNDILPEEQDNTETSDTIENDNTTQENETIEDTNEDTTALEDITLENEDNTLENSDEEINENEDNNDENTDNNDENNTELTGDIQGTEELEQTNDEEETSTNNDEESTIEESNPTTGNNYIITRVSSTGEANWVLPAFCGDDIFCNNLHQTFTPCIEFKRNEKLNDNANRIGNNGVCRFKDFSELVYVTFN